MKNSFQPTPLSKENIIVRINEDAEFNFLRYHQIIENTVIPPSFFLVSNHFNQILINGMIIKMGILLFTDRTQANELKF